MFLVNIIQKEMGATNLYVDDNRRLTLYTSIVMVNNSYFKIRDKK